jgi:predicted alpha/beta-fold hydrolase
MLTAADYLPPRWLRNPHLQSMLSSAALRRRRGLQALQRSGAVEQTLILDGGDGVRLQGVLSTVPGRAARGLTLLLHGWEGSTESSYMRMTAAQMLARGFDVFRLNFRDHGGTHHLNVELFHSARLDEVVTAAQDLLRRVPSEHLLLAGYSLGGNFALRLALHAGEARLPLRRVAAVCPLLDPATTMDSIEHGPVMYDWYFRRKWRESLLRKRKLFPEHFHYTDTTLALDTRGLMRWMAHRHAGFRTLDAYFEAYSIAGDRLAGLAVPADILMAEDDPVIPYGDFTHWHLPATATLEIARWGGHCGFIENAVGDGFSERWVAEHLEAGVSGGRTHVPPKE